QDVGEDKPLIHKTPSTLLCVAIPGERERCKDGGEDGRRQEDPAHTPSTPLPRTAPSLVLATGITAYLLREPCPMNACGQPEGTRLRSSRDKRRPEVIWLPLLGRDRGHSDAGAPLG